MKKMTIVAIIVGFLCGSINLSRSQTNANKSGTTAAQFLKIGVGARALGLGGAYVALANDIYGLYWNPAGICKVRRVTLAAVHTQWFADVTHQFLGFVIPVGRSSAVGFQATFLNMDPIEITTIDDPHGTGEFFDASDLAIGVSYATRLTNFFAVGLTGKFIQQSIYNEDASAFAFDVGSLLDVPFYGMRLGMQFSNFGGKLQMDGRDLIREFDMNPRNTLNVGVETRLRTQPWELPVNFRVGLAVDILGRENGFLKSPHNVLSLSIDGNHPADGAEYAVLGLEYIFNDVIVARGGYRFNRDVEKFFYGVGLQVPLSGASFHFDYALASFDELDYVHIFSGSISF